MCLCMGTSFGTAHNCLNAASSSAQSLSSLQCAEKCSAPGYSSLLLFLHHESWFVSSCFSPEKAYWVFGFFFSIFFWLIKLVKHLALFSGIKRSIASIGELLALLAFIIKAQFRRYSNFSTWGLWYITRRCWMVCLIHAGMAKVLCAVHLLSVLFCRNMALIALSFESIPSTVISSLCKMCCQQLRARVTCSCRTLHVHEAVVPSFSMRHLRYPNAQPHLCFQVKPWRPLRTVTQSDLQPNPCWASRRLHLLGGEEIFSTLTKAMAGWVVAMSVSAWLQAQHLFICPKGWQAQCSTAHVTKEWSYLWGAAEFPLASVTRKSKLSEITSRDLLMT